MFTGGYVPGSLASIYQCSNSYALLLQDGKKNHAVGAVSGREFPIDGCY